MSNEISEADARRYMMRYRDAAINIESLTAEKERIESAVYSITSGGAEGGGTSAASDKMGNGVASLVDLIDRINAEIVMYRQAREEVRRVVGRVSAVNPIYGQCLHYRYIGLRTAFATAHDLGFSERQERRVHKSALRMATRYM